MAHGTQCNCMMCTVGKKMGMIATAQHAGHDHDNQAHHEDQPGTCGSCSHAHKSDGRCDCGCK